MWVKTATAFAGMCSSRQDRKMPRKTTGDKCSVGTRHIACRQFNARFSRNLKNRSPAPLKEVTNGNELMDADKSRSKLHRCRSRSRFPTHGTVLKFSDIRSLESSTHSSSTSPSGDQVCPTICDASRKGQAPIVPDITKEIDQKDSMLLSEYAADIFECFFRNEETQVPLEKGYAERHSSYEEVRPLLMDWVVEAHENLRFLPESLFLGVSIIDQYLAIKPAELPVRFALVGLVALFIASKVEEVKLPQVENFVSVMRGTITKREIFALECEMLTALDFQILVATPLQFFGHLQMINQCDDVQQELAQYIIELALVSIGTVKFPPSHMVSAALLLSNELFCRTSEWPETMVKHSQYEGSELRSCVNLMRLLLVAAPTSELQAVRNKFASREHQCVACMNFFPP